jgi:hypothetical protein
LVSFPRKWYIDVECDYCNVIKKGRSREPGSLGGCIACCDARSRLGGILRDWGAKWRPALIEDRTLAPIAADWCEDNDVPEMAKLLRAIK